MLSGSRERDTRPCVTRVRSVLFERCPASARICALPGFLGNASGSFSLVMASVDVIVADVCSYLSGRVGFRGKRLNRHGLVEWGVRPPPLIPMYGLCGKFKVSVASFFRVM